MHCLHLPPAKIYLLNCLKKAKTFLSSWLQDPLFSGWLQKHPFDQTKFICKACGNIYVGGHSEIVKHSNSKIPKTKMTSTVLSNCSSLFSSFQNQVKDQVQTSTASRSSISHDSSVFQSISLLDKNDVDETVENSFNYCVRVTPVGWYALNVLLEFFCYGKLFRNFSASTTTKNQLKRRMRFI